MLSPTVSFIIIEFHSLDDIQKCIMSIKEACDGVPFEIVVSSNSCYSIEIQKKLRHDLPNVLWHFNEKNGGFAYAMNQGLKIAHGEFLAIINPDVRIKSGLSQMIDFIRGHLSVGAIAPQIVNSRGMTQDSARPYVNIQRYILRCIKRVLSHKSSVLDNNMDYSQVQTVDWIIGAFIMVRREVYKNTAGMDEYYFMYAEDLDWCTRIRACGYEIVYYPWAKIEYEGSRSARHSFKYAKIFLRSHLHYWKKNGFFWGYPKRKSLEAL